MRQPFDPEAYDRFVAGAYDPDQATEGAKALAPRLAGFALFRNGGRPKLERRSHGLVFEVVVKGTTQAVWADLHVSHLKLSDLRASYGKGRRAPTTLVSGNVGMFHHPPQRLAWDDVRDFASDTASIVGPWCDLLASGDNLQTALGRGAASALPPDAAAELLYLELGAPAARAFVRSLRQSDRSFDLLIREGEPRLSGPWIDADPKERLAAFALTHRLD